MSVPLKRHSERVNYIRCSFIEAARCARSVQTLESGRVYIWSDLEQIADENVRREAQQIFRQTMQNAEALEARQPEEVGRVIMEGMSTLIDYLEANDIGESDADAPSSR